MPEVSIKDQIKKLVDLQTIDAEIYLYKRDLREKPLYVEELKKRYEDKKAGLKALEEKAKAIQVNRKAQELELQTKEGDIVKANAQLSLLKTNKEYQAKLTEIQSMKADKSVIEEKILVFYDESDAVNADIEKERKFLAEEEQKYLTQKKEVDDSVKEIEEKLKVLNLKRSQITPDISKSNLSRYERVLENKDGLAIVPVNGNSCGGCFMSVPDQVINEIKMHERLVLCEMCSRVLYLADDL
ncbi:MAG TPA: C4-type zinc ribbon domain-containing protein [Candidatus Omnitrophota bacterium]|nr:C4-type zinc ribbon domain-containing protein [Candidatus Omnitrophota bacterium]HPD84044.1 C4-type zinc ribbon domain-containing protein [Candidatus Omnitrophota bacterium]HRZ02901.1 C4-type zinc ribbon domain-containing protein [Candidatus Omnitrophota bacterium]